LLRAHYPGETDGSLCVRIFWAFATVQYMELSGIFVHADRTHFLTSVYRLLFKADPSQKPNQTYVRHALGEADKLLAIPAGRWAGQVINQENKEQTKWLHQNHKTKG
jgi:hypothetical protein